MIFSQTLTDRFFSLHDSCHMTQALKKIRNSQCTVFDFLTLQKATENFLEQNKLGHGGFGMVHKVSNRENETGKEIMEHRAFSEGYFIFLSGNTF